MKILLLADTEDPALWDYFSPDRVKGYDLILAAGDLKAEYLTFLVTMSNLPVFYVHGNHNAAYDHYPPEGCECIDDRLVTYRGLRILGLGGSARYSREPYQYTEREMRRRIARLRFAVWKARGVDIVLTHCPPKGYGDADDYAHRGFEAFLPMLDRWKPKALVHGHVHMTYGDIKRELPYGETRIINAYQRYTLEIDTDK
ncbi:MAG: metallophosphoesterase [Clostridia bacterium]|jgi:Icc-related predicted phosphoesterase|nr:metallophosphoesterase [Clostridia bacterium]